MAYKTKYILSFENELNELYEIYFDYLDFLGDAVPIFGAENALTLRSTTGDQNKFEPILGTECLINIVVGKITIDGVTWDNDELQIDDLIAQHDNDIRITVYRDQDYTTSIFQGFIVVEDNSQPFLDPPFVLSVRALDGLGLLKNVDMIDTTGALYTGVLSIEDWLGNILYKTGQTLNLRVYFPFYPADAAEGVAPLQQVFLNAQTWQRSEIITSTDPSVDVFASEAVDAFTALQIICTCLVARIFQEDGCWNFVSLYSYADPGGMFYNESTGVLTDGIYNMTQVSVGRGLVTDVPVGESQIVHPVKDDAIRYIRSATKWIKLNYTYNQSFNKICNQNFQQGVADPSFDGTISSTIENASLLPVVTFDTKGYNPFCWTLHGGTLVSGGLTGSVPFPATAQTEDIYIRSVLDVSGTEESRYLVINHGGSVASYARSSTFLVDQNDNLQVSFDFRTRIDASPTTLIPMWILMDGDDGNKYGYGGQGVLGPYEWYLLDANYQISAGFPYPPPIYQSYAGGTGQSTNDWNSISISKDANGNLIKAPVSGSVFILLAGQVAAPVPGSITDEQESWFKNIQITILPYFRGSYVQLKGDYNFLSSTNNVKQTLANEVEISDSPKRYFQGALIKANNDLIPPTWHRRSVSESLRFTQLMERLIYNNLVRIYEEIEGTMRGVTWVNSAYDVKPLGFLNRYHFTDHNTPTKQFIQTSFEMDYSTGYGRRVFVEVLNDQNDTGWDNPSEDPVFQYLYQ